jgi:hypothetical protein
MIPRPYQDVAYEEVEYMAGDVGIYYMGLKRWRRMPMSSYFVIWVVDRT